MSLSLKPSHKIIKDYYAALKEFETLGVKKETSVRSAFGELLRYCARKFKWTFVEEYTIRLANGNKGAVDGAVLTQMNTVFGHWEAKDTADDLKKEIKSKFKAGYPSYNILFWTPEEAVLYQDGSEVGKYDLRDPNELVHVLTYFFESKAKGEIEWEDAVESFKERMPEFGKKLIELIEVEKRENPRFKAAFRAFADLCKSSINPNLSDEAVEEMLIQHLLMRRIFATIFGLPDFIHHNPIGQEIEKVVKELTSRNFNPQDFFKPLEVFYARIEAKAATITEWSEKQIFLNTVYEKFFQGFSVKVADTHGIVYTPQPIVDFMVKSVQHILKTEFGRSLADEGVHILDPFVGTGNFIMRIMREIGETQKTKLPKKYKNELHCNEVMLLPYYIASMNIEHEYFQQTGRYEPFDGICLVDTFELAEPAQTSLFTTENTERVERQKKAPIFVIIGNPPYNAGQVNEGDNNKNRKYPEVDKRVRETYASASRATLVNQLGDPYVKAFRFASDRIGNEGVVAFISNSSFLDGRAFDGMRKHLRTDFSSIFILDLGGDVRKNPKLSGTTNNVFGIQVGVSINLLIRGGRSALGALYYAKFGEFDTRAQKYRFLNEASSVERIPWVKIEPDHNGDWFNEDLASDFEGLMPLGSKTEKRQANPRSVFRTFSNGLKTNRDCWMYNFSRNQLEQSVRRTVRYYNSVRMALHQGAQLDGTDPMAANDREISWSRDLKKAVLQGTDLNFDNNRLRLANYRPFSKQWLYFDRVLNEETLQFPAYCPERAIEKDNTLICLSGIGILRPFHTLAVEGIADVQFTPNGQCFPFYTYGEDGSNRKENITDWALKEFQTKLKDKKITKWDIFYYVYGILHHPEYRTKYAANLRRELPRIPISKDFWAFSKAGKKLADMHVHYEDQKEYPLQEKWREGAGLNLRVEKMKLSKDKRDLIYNEDLALTGVPPETFDYRLGNRSALDWIIDQYQVSTDKRSGITNDPNREDDDTYILRLIKKVITVSVETLKVVKEIEGLGIEDVANT